MRRARSPGLDALGWSRTLDPQAHVEHHAAIGHAPHRVQVGLDDLRRFAKQQREAQYELAQCGPIEEGQAAGSVELRGHLFGRV